MKARVLIVDDDAAIREVLGMRLEAMGFEVHAAPDAPGALAVAEAHRFDLALVDLRMEPVDGIRLMESLHARQPRLPVLIMTAHGTIETAVEAVRRGAFDYLTKPFVPDEVRAKIDRALAARRWARDRARLLRVGETLASSGVMERILDAVVQAVVDTIEAERSVVFQVVRGRLVPMASAGTAPPSWAGLEAAASEAMDKGVPTTVAGGDGGAIVAAPLLAERGPAGALVIETGARLTPTEDDLELLALFSAHAATAIRTTHELERLRSGALAALGRMATQVAHEIKNPLAGLRLYARHLEQRLARGGDHEGVELTRKIASTIEHLAAVVAEITAFGRPPELRRAPVALGPLLDECLALARARCPSEGVEVVRDYDRACPTVEVDAREIRKALLNLVLNGLEALGGAGRLTVVTRCADEEEMVTITIEDTGIGMSEETLARVFDFFFTTKPEGTGLGMAISRSVIDLHGGELRIESAPGGGTRVRVTLPGGPRPSAAKARGGAAR